MRLFRKSRDTADVREDPTMSDHTTVTEDQAHRKPDPLTDSGVHEAVTEPKRVACPLCFGTGHVMTKNEILRQSLTLLGDDPKGHQAVVAEFYRRLLLAAPDLARLFPADLTDPLSSGEGKVQRDRLLGALLEIGQFYDPDNPESEQMKILLTHIQAWGRSHVNFARSDSPSRTASIHEYGAVYQILMGTLHEATGAAWSTRFDEVWAEAYDFAARGMIASAWGSGFRSERYPRA